MKHDQTPENYIEFCSELELLLNNGNFKIENTDTILFIKSMQAWLCDTQGGSDYFNGTSQQMITWEDLITLIKASAIYE